MAIATCLKKDSTEYISFHYRLIKKYLPGTGKKGRRKLSGAFFRSKALICAFIAISCFAYDSLVLDIPARNQWNFSNGYCGSCSIQMSALYHGSYVSQDLVRKSIGDLEILFGNRMNDALDAVSFFDHRCFLIGWKERA